MRKGDRIADLGVPLSETEEIHPVRIQSWRQKVLLRVAGSQPCFRVTFAGAPFSNCVGVGMEAGREAKRGWSPGERQRLSCSPPSHLPQGVAGERYSYEASGWEASAVGLEILHRRRAREDLEGQSNQEPPLGWPPVRPPIEDEDASAIGWQHSPEQGAGQLTQGERLPRIESPDLVDLGARPD